MTSVPRLVRALFRASLIGGPLCAVAACGTGTSAPSGPVPIVEAKSTSAQSRAPWQEPASYTYTLRSSQEEQPLIGAFRITVRDGAVVKAVGLDESGRHVAEDLPDAVPTIGQLLKELEQARRDDAFRAEAQYAADGHPVRITLDRDENALDDEALYDISAYEPANG